MAPIVRFPHPHRHTLTPDPHDTPPRRRYYPRLRAAACAAAALFSAAAFAQGDPVQSVTITGRSSNNSAGIAGFGDVPLYRSPFSASVINTSQLVDAGITGLGDLTRLDAATTDAYNAPGYWGLMAVRGFTLDPQFNVRRDGLPINAETMIPLANKRGLELLKGTSGLQAGTSAPGGLLNLSVKRPAGRLRQAALGWLEDDTRSIAVDLGDGDARLGWRVNAEYAHLQPQTFNSRGHRKLAALAVDAEPRPGTLLEAEVEFSHQSQPSTPGLSLLGSELPDAKTLDPRLNLNNQPWRLPVVLDGRTGSVRVTQTLSGSWQLVAHAMRQRLDSDDRIAFPFGCSAEDDYTRYCSDGSFDLYDFRSEGERRTTDALDLSARGRLQTGSVGHELTLGLLRSRLQARFQRQAYNWVGVGSLDGQTVLPADPSLTDENTHRDERSTEWRLQDRLTLGGGRSLWLGLRHTALDRRSERTDGSRASTYSQGFTTPWLAFSQTVGSEGLAYASWGEGIESTVTPNRARYTQPGVALPALRSRGVELGYKHHGPQWDWSLAAFDIERPEWADLGPCEDDASCTRQSDGRSRHRGLEGEAEWRTRRWSLRGSALWLQARREGSAQAGVNGLQPTNVPTHSVKAQAAYNVGALPGLALLGYVTHEGRRMVLPDNSVSTPGWTRLDLAARFQQRLAAGSVVWRVGLDNVLDARAWKESPYQFGHAYLYPLQPRTWSLSAQLTL